MAYVNGNKPIVTNGLIYALDFGNTRSYNSGSTSAYPLNFTVANTSSVFQPFTYDENSLLFEEPLGSTLYRYIKTTGSIFDLSPFNEFTITFTTQVLPSLVYDSGGSFIIDNNGDLKFAIQLNETGVDLGYYNPYSETYYTRRYPLDTTLNQTYITCRYNQGHFDVFADGLHLTASEQGVIPDVLVTSSYSTDINFKDTTGSLQLGATDNSIVFEDDRAYKIQSFFGALSQFYFYNRALSYDEIYESYLINQPRYNLTPNPRLTRDENLQAYLNQTGFTDTTKISALTYFVQGLKNEGLWTKLVGIYPFLDSTTTNLKEPTLNSITLSGSWYSSNTKLTPSSSNSYGIIPDYKNPILTTSSLHLAYLSYDAPAGESTTLIGTQQPLRAYGGQVLYSGSKTYHIFTTTGTSSLTILDPTLTAVETLVVAGGGSGGSHRGGGGGGAGGLIYSSSYSITPGTYTVVVGEGGQYEPSSGNSGGQPPGFNGKNSIFDTLTVLGGGGGGYGFSSAQPGANGGSGGGGGGYSTGVIGTPGTGSLGQGNDGGSGSAISPYYGGGGGGAGSTGSDGTVSQGAGGSGSYFPQYVGLNLGVPAGWFAGGGAGRGGGAIAPNAPGGGGGSSDRAGKRNTGGGGNGGVGGLASGDGGVGYAGGSGIVIISYDTNPVHYTGSTKLVHTETGLSGSIGNELQGGVAGGGTIGFAVISRTGDTSLTLYKNNISSSLNIPVSGSIGGNLYLNAVNINETASQFSPYQISYASVGAGLTDSEVSTYYNLVSQLQTNLKRQNTLLDNYSGAAAAYSLRRIGPSGYFGPAIRVRRDSDNTLRDIGFTSDGQLDTVGLLDFVGVTGSGFVNTWYDQSGNGKDASQATAGSQPLVINSGSIFLDRNKPAIYSPDRTLNSVSLPSHDYLSLYILATPLFDPGNSYGWFRIGTSPTYRILAGYSSNGPGRTFYTKGGVSTAWNAPISPNQQILYNIDADNDNLLAYVNNILTNNTPQAGVMGGGTNFIIGSGGNFGISPANFQEIIYYTSSRRDINTTLNSNILSAYTTGSDPDYQAFITATGITEPTQSAALETLVSDLKSYGLWSKMKAIYPMVTDRNNRFAQSEAFNLTWNAESASVAPNQIAAPDGTTTADLILDITSSVPIQTFTVVNNGASAYTIDGVDNPELTLERGKTYQFNVSAEGHPFWIKTAYTIGTGDAYNDGVTNNGIENGTITFTVPQNAPSPLYYICQYHSSMGNTITVNENSDQHYIYQTIDGDTGIVTGSEYVLSTYAKFYNTPYIAFKTNTGAQAWFDVQTGVTGSYTGSNATITNVGNGWYRCALYFTSSVATGPYNQQIHLARTNNDLTFAGTGTSGSYLWGAQFENGNLLGPYRKTEGSGFAVSGSNSMLDQMKFNLVNPVDTNAAGRLTAFGTCNFGYDGIKTGTTGTNSFLSTNFTSSTIENTHFSIYRTDEPIVNGGGRTDIGITSGNATLGIDAIINTQRTTTSVDGGLTARFQLPQVTVGTKKANMYIISRVPDLTAASGSYSKFYRANTLLNTYNGPLGIQNLTGNRQILIGALDYYGGPEIINNSWTNGTYPFATIGDGLTDYEAKALYWIVQKFQTTLGRQVY
jgi:hypothetical protein